MNAQGTDHPAAEAMLPCPERPAFVARGLRYFWFRIGHAHIRSVLAAGEDDARRAVLAQHPHARGQRLTISAWEG